MKQIVKIKINSKLFRLELEEEVAEFIQDDFAQYLGKDNNSLKDLLDAYIRKSMDQYHLHKKVEDLNQKLS
jgi:hypothetical protein